MAVDKKVMQGSTRLSSSDTVVSAGQATSSGFVADSATKIPDFNSPQILIKLEPGAVAPSRAHTSDAGADLYSLNDDVISPTEAKMLDTGVSVVIPKGYFGLVTPRSSHGKLRIGLANTVGVIDADYRGTIKLILTNSSTKPYQIKAGETKIAQLVIVPCMLAEFQEASEEQWEKENTVRGDSGFGSTGV